jgi:acyl carrier protein
LLLKDVTGGLSATNGPNGIGVGRGVLNMTGITRDTILETIYLAIEVLDEALEEGHKLELSEEAILYGPGAVLNSMALVRLIVEVEQILFENFDVEISLIDEKALSQKESPFRRVKSLVDYIYSNLGEQG